MFIQWFTPGYKSGGPSRSIQNFVDLFAGDFDLRLVTSDRDLGDDKPYKGIEFDTWMESANHTIIYLSPEKQTIKSYRSIISDTNPHIIYLNSLYAFRFSLLPLITAKLLHFSGRILLAPRGMLKASAVEFKKTKKKIFLLAAKIIGLFNKVEFLATDKQEFSDIQNTFHHPIIHLIDEPPFMADHLTFIKKVPDQLQAVLIGRVHPIKGIEYVLERLKGIPATVELNIIGWIEDTYYYKKCIEITKSLPDNITVRFLGNIPFPEVTEALEKSHILILPTKGENFGHAIFESFSHGRPVIISDQTPWKNLTEKNVGWDIPLDQPAKFTNAILTAASLDQDEYDKMSQDAYRFSREYYKASNIHEKYLTLFSIPVNAGNNSSQNV